MKKILLIIALTLCIFQMVVLAVDIDIGSAAIDRGLSLALNQTWINKSNSANATGTITSIEIYANVNLSNCEVASFFVVSGNNYSTRDYVVIGTVPSGSKQTFEVDLDVEAGDFIGLVFTAGYIEYDNAGGDDGVWKVNGDYIPCEDETFTIFSDYGQISLYGTNVVVGWPHKWNTVTIGKWNTKEFTKWNDLE